MRPVTKLASALVAATIPAHVHAATIGGYYHAVQYDYREFYAATDGKPFQVIVDGNPFPGMSAADMAPALLAQMQANKPRGQLTFTYDTPPQEQHPYYRLYLIPDPANEIGRAHV